MTEAATGDTRRRPFRGYAVTCLAVVAAAGAVRLLRAVGYEGLSPLFAALIVGAWYGGIGPAVLGIVLTTLSAYYLLPKSAAGQLYREDFLRATVFSLTAMVAVAVHLAARRTEEAAKRARKAAEQANEAKTRLLAMVSHDLRNPLNPIRMALAVAEQDPVVAERAKAPLDLIRSSVALQARLIEDLLDVARLATGKFKVTLAPLDLHETLGKALLACAEDLKEKRLSLETDLAARATMVRGDSARLQQVFWNLLNNAIKFSPSGGQIAVRTRDDAAGWIAVEVRDNGVGIEPDKLPILFRAFEQADAGQAGGLGLGLAICQGVIDAHGGTISAASAGIGAGAAFTVRLPVVPADASKAASAAGGMGTESAQRKDFRGRTGGRDPL